MKMCHCSQHGAYAADHCPRCPSISPKSNKNSHLQTKQGIDHVDTTGNAVLSPFGDFPIPTWLRPHFNCIEDVLAGLADGAVTSAVPGLQRGSETVAIRRYWQLIDALVAAGYPVGQYKHNMVSWSNPDA